MSMVSMEGNVSTWSLLTGDPLSPRWGSSSFNANPPHINWSVSRDGIASAKKGDTWENRMTGYQNK